MSAKVAVVYYSATGNVYKLAQAVEEGAQEAGAEVRFRKVRELARALCERVCPLAKRGFRLQVSGFRGSFADAMSPTWVNMTP